MSLAEQIIIIVALCTVPFSSGLTSNLFRCTTPKEDFVISGSMALFHGVFILLGMILGRWIIDFAGSMGFAIGVGTMMLVGIKMIKEALKGDPDDRAFKLDDHMMIIAMSLAASMNGFILAIGLPAFVDNITIFSVMALLATFIITFGGIKLGKRYSKYKPAKYAVIVGGGAIIAVTVVRVYLTYFA